MPTPILMPALSPTMTEGNLARWVKNEGDAVKAGDVICEIETDKATMEVEAVDEGTLGKILVQAGTEGVKVNEPIALLLGEGEDAGSVGGGQAQQKAPEPAKAKGGNGAEQPAAAAAPAKSEPPPAKPSEAKSEPAPAPAAPKTEPAPAKPAPAQARSGGDGEADRIAASPLARRMAQQAGLDLAALKGSGPHGRIVKADIEAALQRAHRPAEAKPAAPAPPPAPTQPAAREAAAVPPPAAPIAPPTGAYDEITLSTMRKVIARRLAEAKQTIPHFYMAVDVELDRLLELRTQLNARPGADYKLSVNDFVIKAVALALKKVPACNAAWGGDKIYQFKDIDVSVAVAIPNGLITPIVRRADQKGLATISNEMKDLVARAKAGKLKPEEFQGGGFSISNLGMYGIKDFQAVINPPQACILAVGSGDKRPVVKNDALAIATVMTLTLSVDHRIVDGAIGAELLQELKRLLEDPMGLLV